MPKPDVVALTGGYRRTPFLQIGADIYCDTALICRVLEQHRARAAAVSADRRRRWRRMVAQWADSALFWAAMPYTTAAGRHRRAVRRRAARGGEGLRRRPRGDDRRHARGRRGRRRGRAAGVPAALDAHSSATAGVPARRRAVRSPTSPSCHPLWFVRRARPDGRDPAAARTGAGDWFDRMLAFGHGTHAELSTPPTRSRGRAAAAARTRRRRSQPGQGFEAGQRVTVAATDYGTDAVAGSAGRPRRRRDRDRAATTRAPAACTCTFRASASRCARTGDHRMKTFQGPHRGHHRRRLGLRPRSARASPRAGHERGAWPTCRRRAGRAPPPRSQALGAAGAAVQRSTWPAPPRSRRSARPRCSALRRAALRLQQRRRRRRRADLGEHASPTGNGCSASTSWAWCTACACSRR